MADLFSTNSLINTVYSLLAPPQFLLSHFFPIEQTEQAEEIHFDTLHKTRRLAPFVSQVVAGKIVRSEGFTTSTFKPAYIKDKRIFEPDRPFKRAAGEPIGGRISPMERLARSLTIDLQDQKHMVDRRLETMAAEALLTGGVTITGDEYPTQHVDFVRDPALTVTLPTLQNWNQAAISPLDNLQDWAQLILKKSGAMAVDAVMPVDVWKIFRKHPQIEPRLKLFNNAATLKQDAQKTEYAEFMGGIDGFNIFVYAGWYLDDNGTEQPILPPGKVLLVSRSLDGVRAFGAIHDEEAGFQALPYFPKSWTEPDPAVRYLLMQSAPLVVPTRVNASLAATVL
jgi:Phage major capsid protein E